MGGGGGGIWLLCSFDDFDHFQGEACYDMWFSPYVSKQIETSDTQQVLDGLDFMFTCDKMLTICSLPWGTDTQVWLWTYSYIV